MIRFIVSVCVLILGVAPASAQNQLKLTPATLEHLGSPNPKDFVKIARVLDTLGERYAESVSVQIDVMKDYILMTEKILGNKTPDEVEVQLVKSIKPLIEKSSDRIKALRIQQMEKIINKVKDVLKDDGVAICNLFLNQMERADAALSRAYERELRAARKNNWVLGD